MTKTRLFLASVLAMAACSDDADKKIPVAEWATEMARASAPDTIQDKFAIVEDTDDPRAFDGVIEIAKEQSAAETEADP